MSGRFNLSRGRTQTPIGMLPTTWGFEPLGENAYIKARIGWRGLSADEYTSEGALLVAGTHIRGPRIDWSSCDHISDFRYEESPEIQLQEDDVILSKDGTLGRVGIVEHLPGRATINGTMMLVRPDRDVFWPRFLYYYLQGDNFRRFIREKVSGSSVPHIFQRDMVRFLAPRPSVPEQHKIASILSSVDDVIEKTQAVVDQVQIVKRGLTQDLLSRGIPEQHTQFKRTNAGTIPSTWTVDRIRDLGQKRRPAVKAGPFGSSLKKSFYVPSGYRVYGQEQVLAGDLSLGDYYIDAERYRALESCAVRAGDILMSLVGTFGQALVVPPEAQPGIINPRLVRLSLDPRLILPEFFCYWLQCERTRKLLANAAQGGTMGVLNAGIVKNLTLGRPPIDEQKAIVAALTAVDRRLDSEIAAKASASELKSALMSVLLTGELRVTPDPEPE